MAGINRQTFKLVSGVPDASQKVGVILTTRIGERVMRRHFGFAGTALLGRLLTPSLLLSFFTMIAVAINLWEPRFKVTRITAPKQDVDTVRRGEFAFETQVAWRPRAHLGDFTIARFLTLNIGLSSDGVTVSEI